MITEKDLQDSGTIFSRWVAPFLMLLILAGSVYFRVAGLFWGNYQFLHPDERFLIGVTNNLTRVESLSEYFNTALSTLNPHNTGNGFYVYGDLPIILTRYISSFLFDNVSWNQITQVGRGLSAMFDMGSVLLVFLIGKKLFNSKIGLLAAAFSGLAVLQIQQSHFYTVDTFSAFFTTLAAYLAVVIVKTRFIARNTDEEEIERIGTKRINTGKVWIPYLKLLLISAVFGTVIGMAAASKVNTVFAAVLLPIAYIVIWNRYPEQDPIRKSELILRDLVVAAIFAILAFRIFQPYAFAGPGFFNFQLNPKWLSNIKELSNLSNGDVDYPPALQWARRDFFFAAKNITLWGLGIPLSIPFWSGLAFMAWLIMRGQWRNYAVIWFWAAGYFLWQSAVGNPMMRYQMPVYPLFALIAAWFIFTLATNAEVNKFMRNLLRIAGYSLGIIAVLGTAIWAYMFTRIYIEPMTRVEASRWIYDNIPGPINLQLDKAGVSAQEVISVPYNYEIENYLSYNSIFSLDEEAQLTGIALGRVIRSDKSSKKVSEITISIFDLEGGSKLLTTGKLENSFQLSQTDIGVHYTVDLEPDVFLAGDHNYQLVLDYVGSDSIKILGSAVAVESTWDDPLPVRLDGRDPFGGIYQDKLNFEMYFKDDQDKLNRFYSTLNQTEYIFMSSNRQWGTTTRVPERYPLTTKFYRSLLGCPESEEVTWCYSVAQPGDFQGELGFELVQVFDSYPHLGDWEINDQFAEESFSVYDHPKVMIFKKTPQYNSSNVMAILSSVDLQKVRNLTPAKFPEYPADLELPPQNLQVNQQGGTWAQLFDRSALINTNPFLTIVIWYFSITLFGWLLYPLVRIMLSGLVDRGFAFSKLVAMLLLALIIWLAGSNGIAVSRIFIQAVVGVLAIIGIVFGIIQWKEIVADLRTMKEYFIWVEIIGIFLFALFLLIRVGNPDLWHPAKGGEKPMDFAYLNAVIKSTTFPPYDPWYAGGYINYYYYGFVIVGIWVKLLGIIPSTAYNLILPLLFSLLGLGAFGFIWNGITLAFRTTKGDLLTGKIAFFKFTKSYAFLGGFLGVLFTILIGNLGTLRMLWQGFQKLGSSNGIIDSATIFERLLWSIKGLVEFISGANLPYSVGDWYWNPSRVLPQSPITEFPFFTFVYGDLHAHMIALPITLLVLGWCLAVISSRWNFHGKISASAQKGLVVALGAIVIGALRPTNTWDYPTYLLLASIVLVYTILKNGFVNSGKEGKGIQLRMVLEALGFTIALVILSALFYKPFSDWYGQAYSAIELWKGDRSPFWSFFTHWGFFFSVITSWFMAETYQWMESTPFSSLRKLQKYQFWLWIFVFVPLLLMIILILLKVAIVWLVLPLAVWAVVLIFRSDQTDFERLILFMTGTALVLTLFVEVFVLRGDIARMNTVFKFYLQVWVFLALSAAFGAVWLWRFLLTRKDSVGLQLWKYTLLLMFAFTAMYPLLAGTAKIDDRISSRAKLTLDGMQYMQSSFYVDEGKELDLSQDYDAIRWMQDNVDGSPVIVEGNTVEYRWGSRFSIYTGLADVIGWNWHQRQQRAVLPSEWITKRVDEVRDFYETYDIGKAEKFLDKYNVRYVIVGQLERALYPGPGLRKFELDKQNLWREVYRNKETVILEVIKQ